ncbi:three-Cys-motif partner protein TcmP [Oceanicola sp. S124]|uniref:three-Cys-motif partner protein TcmP n=1 Tax=Oceanicola sp. S124 TaxID=1042378 RepID=UPI00110FD579|nr:three-Cys-motif partner protein TcmP [Oceanicola sp. S124]
MFSTAPSSPFIVHDVKSRQRPIDHVPAQSNLKSMLIAEYIKRFQLITKGGLYIDGFAAPQSRLHEEAWTARRVLEVAPPRLSKFWLCDLDPKGCEQLRELKRLHDRHPKFRRVWVLEGDFNQRVDEILKGGRISRNAPVFALLDQRNMECKWRTVQAIAARKGAKYKIEMMYFVGTAWLLRAVKTRSTAESLRDMEQWWGGPGWQRLMEINQQEAAVKLIARRFTEELGYRTALVYPVPLLVDGERTAFHLVHASDHPEAPRLMDEAFRSVIGQLASQPSHLSDQGELEV